jgi:hypothetical protein
LLQEGDALAEESKEISRRANIMREQEQQRRDDEVRRAKSDNKDIESQNKSDQDRYKQDMERWKKEIDEKCNYSQCNKGYSKYFSLLILSLFSLDSFICDKLCVHI